MPEISDLVKYAINYLSKYSSSKKNLERILKNKIRRINIEKKLYKSIPEVLKKLEKNNFINDYNYATSKVNTLISNGKSKIFIRNYLFKKEIDEKLSADIFTELDAEDSYWEIKSARIFARKKNIKKNDNNNEKNLSKMARAGFSYEIAKKILEEN